MSKKEEIVVEMDFDKLIEMKDEIQEMVKLVTYDGCFREINTHVIALGGVQKAEIDPKIVWHRACADKATHIVLCHNHVEGELAPSQADIKTTKNMMIAGKSLGINLIDHLIVNEKGELFSIKYNRKMEKSDEEKNNG